MSVSPTVVDGNLYPNIGIDTYFESSEEKAFDATPDSGIHEIGGVTDPEQKAKLEEEWKTELAKTEEEIATLRQVLSVKVKYAQDLKRKLGITPWKELKEDVEQSLRNIQETPAMKEVGGRLVEWNSAITSAPIYQKTSQTVKTAAEKTTSVLGVWGASVSKKLGEVKGPRWPGSKVSASGPESSRTAVCVTGCTLNLGQMSSFGVVRKFGGRCHLRCRPQHLIVFQNLRGTPQLFVHSKKEWDLPIQMSVLAWVHLEVLVCTILMMLCVHRTEEAWLRLLALQQFQKEDPSLKYSLCSLCT